MTVHINNTRIRELVKRMQWAARAEGASSVLDQTIWIEISPETDKTILSRKHAGTFSAAFLLVPYPNHLVEHHAKIYEQLSHFLKALQNQSVGIIYVIPIAAALEETLQTVISLIRMELTGEKHQANAQREYEEPGTPIYLVRKGILQVWDERSFREECLAEAAEVLFRWEFEKEQEQLENLQLTEELGLQDVSGKSLQEVYEQTLQAMRNAFQMKQFRPQRRTLIRAFGLGKSGSPSLLHTLNPNALFREEESLPSLLNPPVQPRQTLVEIAARLRELIPTFYLPQLPNLNTLSIFRFEEGAGEQIFETPLWQGNHVDTLNNQLAQLIQQNAADLVRIRELTGRERRRQRQQVTHTILALSRELRIRIDEEIGALLMIPNLFELSPTRAANAYIEVYQTLFTSLCQLFPQLWGWRTFLGIPVPPRFPALFYRWSGIIRAARRLLSEIVRLLNVYVTLFQAMTGLRQLHNQFYEELKHIENLRGYSTHTHNILKELEIYVQHRRKLPQNFPDQITDVKELKDLPENFPRADAVSEKLFHRLKSMLPDQPLTAVKEIDALIRQSRTENKLSENPYRSFVPFYFHRQEAWKMPMKLVKALQEDKEVRELIQQELQKLGVEENSEALSSNEYYCSHPVLQRVDDFHQEDFFRSWKKRALQETSEILQDDILERTLPHTEVGVDFLLQEGIRQEFWICQGERIGLTVEVFSWLPPEYRPRYYQHRDGLTRQEFNDLLKNKKCREALLDFVNRLITAAELDSDLYHIELESLSQGDASVNLFDILMVIGEERSNLPEFPHYGLLVFNQEKGRVILKNTLEECFWSAFAPKSAVEAEPRYFLMVPFREWFVANAYKEFNILSKLFLDYCLLQGRDIDVPFE